MKVIIALLLCICAAVALRTREADMQRFATFMREYGRNYGTVKEFNHRFETFRHNLNKIDQLNAQANGMASYNVTKFSDMTVEEFRKYPCGGRLGDLKPKKDFKINMGTLPEVDPTALPPSFDWTTKGAVTGVKDQGQCGSCWAFSVIGNMEGVWFLAGHTLTSLSEEQVVDCSNTDYGCSGGWPFWAMTDMDGSPYNGQIDTEAGYPYTAGNGASGTCQFSTSDVGAVEPAYKSYCNEQTNTCTSAQIQQLLITYGPLSACLDATPMQSYTGGVDHPSDCDPTYIDHCITIVGYGVDSGNPFWKIKNSWGTSWGESGYYRLYRDDSNSGMGVCGINRVITVASVSS
jgi:C1A family cysteine protease